MKIDQYVNKFLTALFGTMPDGDRKVWMHSQNLNEDRNGNPKGLPWHGRLWLRTYRRPLIAFSWNLWTHFCGVGMQADSEDGGTQLHVAFPPVSFWLTLPFGLKKYTYSHHVYYSITVHDWALWWQFGGDSMSWSSKTPKWKNGSFNLADFLLGRRQCDTEVVETKDVLIPMPEGLYPAKAKMEKRIRYRARWFARESFSVSLDIPRGIPHQGKGENSWDCGEDGLFGCGAEGTSYEAAIARAVESVLKSRRKYDGDMMAKYPNPADRPPPATQTNNGNQGASA